MNVLGPLHRPNPTRPTDKHRIHRPYVSCMKLLCRRRTGTYIKLRVMEFIVASQTRSTVIHGIVAIYDARIHFVVVFISVVERHGSGDPTPCGGYPAPACWAKFQCPPTIEPIKRTEDHESMNQSIASGAEINAIEIYLINLDLSSNISWLAAKTSAYVTAAKRKAPHLPTE